MSHTPTPTLKPMEEEKKSEGEEKQPPPPLPLPQRTEIVSTGGSTAMATSASAVNAGSAVLPGGGQAHPPTMAATAGATTASGNGPKDDWVMPGKLGGAAHPVEMPDIPNAPLLLLLVVLAVRRTLPSMPPDDDGPIPIPMACDCGGGG